MIRVIIIFCLFIGIVLLVVETIRNNKAAAIVYSTKSTSKEIQSNSNSSPKSLKQLLKDAINELKEKEVLSYEKYTVEELIAATTLGQSYNSPIAMADTSNDRDVPGYAHALANEILIYQKKVFPKLRSSYASFVSNKLWEENITVESSGKGSTILTFVGGVYASNRNIKTSMDAIDGTVKALRFKRVEFKWIPHDEKYTYYTFSTPADNEY